MYIVTCNTVHKDTVTIFGTFKTIFGARKFLKTYNEKVKEYKSDSLYTRFRDLSQEVNSEDFKIKRQRFPYDRSLASKIYNLASLEKSLIKLAHLYGLEIADDKCNPFEFKGDSTEYIYKINYPINISTKLEV